MISARREPWNDYQPQSLLVLAMTIVVLAACQSSRDDNAASAEDGGTGPSPGLDASASEEAELRPPVQQTPPNAADQTPAFIRQTRAGQPAHATEFVVETITTTLREPWGIAVLPDGRFLVSQRRGSMVIVNAMVEEPISAPIAGIQQVEDSGQGGLLDVALAPDFITSRRIYWSYSEPRDQGSGTSVARGVLSPDSDELTDVEVIFQQLPSIASGGHYGSRLTFAPDGNLFVTLGDRWAGPANPQDPRNTIGAIVRIGPDGNIPDDNPFVGSADGNDALWSYGHRNPQSATLDLEGRFWTVEHGPAGGDELNRPLPGRNYGWPVVSYGIDYGGGPVGDGITILTGTEQPVYYWDPVIAPAGMTVYDGTLFEDWRGDFLIGGLVAKSIVRLSMRDNLVYSEEWLRLDARCRDIAIGVDGAVYTVTDEGALLRIAPKQ